MRTRAGLKLFCRPLAALLGGLLIVPSSPCKSLTAAVAGPSQGTTVRGSEMIQGANIFDGDVVDVSTNGETILNLGGNATARLPAKSAVRVFKCDGRSVLQLLHGGVIFRSTPKQPVEVHLGDATVRTSPQQEGVGEVALTSPATASILAQKGSLTVTAAHERQRFVLEENEATTATLSTLASSEPANPPVCQEPADVPSQPSTSKRVKLGAILLGATAIAIGLALSSRETSLSCPQKGALVSPYQFGCP
jgi:ferric-dicitrate binding protein FerR (iron transport regulator)